VLLLDDLLGRAAHEIGVAELRGDLGDVGVELLHLLSQTGLLGREVDDAFQRQRGGLAADD
jgi:hypothetical protein